MFKPFNHAIFKHDYIGPYDVMMKTNSSVSHAYNGGILSKEKFYVKAIKNYNHEILHKKGKNLDTLLRLLSRGLLSSMCLSLMNTGKLQEVEYNDECKLFLQNSIDGDENILKNAMTSQF